MPLSRKNKRKNVGSHTENNPSEHAIEREDPRDKKYLS